VIDVEHDTDWTRDRDKLGEEVPAALDAIDEIVERAPALAVRRDGVRAQIDDYGVLTLDLPLGSGDAFWLHLGDGWDRLLWIAAAGRNEEWVWDERMSPAFIEAVVNGRANRETSTKLGERMSVIWRWTDADGVEHAQRDSHIGSRPTFLPRLRLRPGAVRKKVDRIDPLPPALGD
jgi:hypothetical protein